MAEFRDSNCFKINPGDKFGFKCGAKDPETSLSVRVGTLEVGEVIDLILGL